MKALVVLAIARSRPHEACLRRVGSFADHDIGRVLSTENLPAQGGGQGRVVQWCKRQMSLRSGPGFAKPDFE